MRFKLDPKAAEVHRPPVAPLPPSTPSAPPPGPAFPPPAAPRRAGAPAAAPAARRNVSLLLALLAIVVLAGAAAAVWFVFVDTYPEKYLVEEGEAPRGMKLALLRRGELDQLGMQENPGRIDQAALEERFATSDGRQPEEGYGEVLDASGDRLALFALRYEDEDAARAAGRTLATICGFANGAVLRDGEVVVVVVPDGASRSEVLQLVEVLREKARGLQPVCGTA